MSVSYAARKDVYACGAPRGSLVPQARLVESVDTTQNVVQISGHGLSQNDAIEFTKSGNGALPSALGLLTIYYVKLITLADGTTDENRFQLSTTVNGAALALVTTGTAPFSMVIALGPTVDRYLEIYSRWVDTCIPGHVVPLAAPYPAEAVNIVSIRTASKLMSVLGRSAPQFQAREQMEIVDFLRMAKGIPLRGDVQNQQPANLAAVANAAIGSLSSSSTRGSLP